MTAQIQDIINKLMKIEYEFSVIEKNLFIVREDVLKLKNKEADLDTKATYKKKELEELYVRLKELIRGESK
jgi:hypothetical protein